TLTMTLTATPTQQPQIANSLKQRLLSERIVVLNNPIKDGVLRIAFYNEDDAIVFISLYNISGELVMNLNKNITAGFSVIQEKISKTTGVYILRTVIKTNTEKIELPLKKVGIIKK
ncbi:MAG: T9SS type A sorting domain-containing protein, partial [Candidatus Goldbacteria bacterium]|nr:T9SS type A sorting domain-containing protein [Candidatus Goldiibacteriota bacterium]